MFDIFAVETVNKPDQVCELPRKEVSRTDPILVDISVANSQPSYLRSTSFPLQNFQAPPSLRARPTSMSLLPLDETNSSSAFTQTPVFKTSNSSSTLHSDIPSNLPKPLLPLTYRKGGSANRLTRLSGLDDGLFRNGVASIPATVSQSQYCNSSGSFSTYGAVNLQSEPFSIPKKVRFSSSSASAPNPQPVLPCLLDLNMGEETDNSDPLIGFSGQSFQHRIVPNRFK